MVYRQAKWDEKNVFEVSRFDKQGLIIDEEFIDIASSVISNLPKELIRNEPPKIPNLSEVEVVRHYVRLSQMSYGVDVGPVPLGSCTMKYNPKICEELASRDEVTMIPTRMRRLFKEY